MYIYIYIYICVCVCVMYNALQEYINGEGNYLLPFQYYYYYYPITWNTVYCLLNTGGATCGAPSQLHSLESSLLLENIYG